MRVLLFLAIMPVYLLCYYVYKKDKEKESNKILTKLFVLGMVSIIPSIIFEMMLGDYFDIHDNTDLVWQFVSIFASVAVIEEFFKWIFVRSVSFNDKEFNHIYDMIVYSVFVSLGFAVVENILYVFVYGALTALVRAITSIPGHACFAIFMGYYLGISKINILNNCKRKYTINTFLSLLIPSLIHAIYDFLLLSKRPLFILIDVVFMIIIYISSYRKINRLSNVSDNFYK